MSSITYSVFATGKIVLISVKMPVAFIIYILIVAFAVAPLLRTNLSSLLVVIAGSIAKSDTIPLVILVNGTVLIMPLKV